MAWFAGQSLVTLVLAFLLGIAVGWLLWARQRPNRSATETMDVYRLRHDLTATREKLASTRFELEECRNAEGLSFDVEATIERPARHRNVELVEHPES